MCAQEFKKSSYMWLNGPMSALDPEVLEGDVGNLRRDNIKNYKYFENDDTGALRYAAQWLEPATRRSAAADPVLAPRCGHLLGRC